MIVQIRFIDILKAFLYLSVTYQLIYGRIPVIRIHREFKTVYLLVS